MSTEESYEEKCWRTHTFFSECDCEQCEHKYDCSGYEGDEENE